MMIKKKKKEQFYYPFFINASELLIFVKDVNKFSLLKFCLYSIILFI